MQLIDKEAVENILSDMDNETPSTRHKILETISERISSLPVYGEWISVKERVPDNEVLCISFHGEFQVWRIADYEDGQWYFCESEDVVLDDITHWQPLPLPPNQ